MQLHVFFSVNGYSVQLLMPESSDEADTPMILSEPFSMGLAFSSDLTDTLLSTVRATDSFVTCSHGLLLPIFPHFFEI